MKYAKRLSNKGRFIGIDQDGEALEAARKRLNVNLKTRHP